MSDVYAGLRYHDADAAIAWLTSVLGLREVFVVRDGAGRVAHAELTWGDGAVMLGQTSDGSDGRLALPAGGGEVYLVTTEEQLRAAYDRGVAAGAKILREPADQGYGIGCTLLDPEGNSWSLGTYRPSLPAPAGAVGWLELGVPDAAPTRDFFGALFDWRVEPMTGDNANFTGPGLRAGLHGSDEARNIVVYFAVDDIDEAVRRVRALGGTADDPGPDQQGFGRYGAATDPEGIVFGLHQYTPPSTG
jgi:uncharacterized glyoxalase superfamily protein PhnB